MSLVPWGSDQHWVEPQVTGTSTEWNMQPAGQGQNGQNTSSSAKNVLQFVFVGLGIDPTQN